MGVGVSNWRLANAVSSTGQLGVVSGTALDQVLARRLQDGDPEGHMRRALAAFPFPDMAARVLDRYFIAGGRPLTASYRPLPMWSLHPPRDLVELCIVANFVEVWLAKEGTSDTTQVAAATRIKVPSVIAVRTTTSSRVIRSRAVVPWYAGAEYI